MSTITDARPRGIYTPTDCPQCRAQQEYIVPPSFIGSLRVRCSSCKTLFSHPQPKPSAGSSSSSRSTGTGTSTGNSTGRGGGGRGIGSDKNPLDMAYYDVLGLDSQCPLEEVKKAYRRLAIKLHPDKNRDDPDAEEKFKQISIAYQVLSEPELRHKYNEFGQKNGGGVAEPAGGFQDPEEVFGKMFGGDRFDDFIGQISIGKDMKEAFQQQHEEEGEMMIGPTGRPMLTPEAMQRKMMRDRVKQEEKARIRKARVEKLAENLKNKLSIFTEATKGPEDGAVATSFREKCRLEAEDLKDESYGVELLNAIGRAYQAKSVQHAASSQFAPLGWFHGAKNSFNVVTDTVSTLRSALELKAVFDRLQAAEGAGLSPEAMRKLEEQAAEQGMRTLWKGAKLEVESVIRETCEKVLSDPSVPKEKLALRVVALGYMADAFLAVQKEGEAPPVDDFVKVETAASKQRDAAAQAAQTKLSPNGTATQPASGRTSTETPRVPQRPAAASSASAPPNSATDTKAADLDDLPEAEKEQDLQAKYKTLPDKEKEETLKAAYKAYESKRKSQHSSTPVQPNGPGPA